VNLARQGPHGAGFADELRNRRARAQFVFELAVAANEAAPFDRLANSGLDPVNIVERFLEIVERASPDAANRARPVMTMTSISGRMLLICSSN
jgi:hypothetical protein